jgi:hypothetical protein
MFDNIKNTLVIGRCWKFVDFLIPTIDSIINYNKHVDIIVIDNASSRSENIASYCNQLLKNNNILKFVAMDKNYFGNVWHINKYFLDIYDKYEYLCFTDLDLKIINPHKDWLMKMTEILHRNSYIGAVSIDFEPMNEIAAQFTFAKDMPENKLPHENFWSILTDGWFYVVRKKDFMEFVSCNIGQMGPGMHGYNKFCDMRGMLYGRTNIIAKHFGWLRFAKEWSSAYEETGISFVMGNQHNNNMEFLSMQGDFNKNMQIPTENSYRIYTNGE